MLKLYNSLTKQKDPFKPIKDKVVLMYDCGPTVYAKPHIGNLARYIMSDILRRYLEYKDYKVKQVMNITDVGHLTEDDLATSDRGEDKIIAQAKKEGKDPLVIARYYEKEFFKAAKKLNLKIAEAYDVEKGEIKNTEDIIIARATDHINDMIKVIKDLVEKGYAYETSKGVYFNVSKFKDYGKLSGNTLDKLQEGKRVKVDPEKKTPYDFALWIKAPKEHLMQWDSPWGRGYPGWHIECTAMSIKYLGEQIDIHTGGEDNIFPHHEDEIAQSESYTGKSPFVKYWIHRRHFLVDSKKMAKSEGNVYTLEDLGKMGYSPEVFKLAILSGKYNSKINFSEDSLKQAKTILKKTFWDVIDSKIKNQDNSKDIIDLEKTLEDDLNTPKAIAIVNRTTSIKLLKTADKILGTNFSEPISTTMPTSIKKLADERHKARKNKDFVKSDKLRKEIEKKGFEIEDTNSGYRVKRK
ncbi:cysteine--tRNA ligase [Patescibacteria group bacterium]|nr:MAG: cysteine--tRNA ligase [Patescibacteria group bacterium]